MKIKILYIGLSVFLLSWIIPSLVELSLDSSSRYPFTYYSSVVNQFCYFDQEDDNVRGRDMSGRTYTDAEFDRVLPMFYYRQLAMENALPDSIQGGCRPPIARGRRTRPFPRLAGSGRISVRRPGWWPCR